MVHHRGFDAWITCGNSVLREYEINVDPRANKVSCWIPSMEGKTFTVHWRDRGGGIDTATFVYLDGHCVPGHFLFGGGEAERSAMRVGDCSERPFCFTSVNAKLEDDTPNMGKLDGKGVGTIMVKIRRVKRVAPHAPNKPQKLPKNIAGRPFPGESHISYGQERPTWNQCPSTWAVAAYDKDEPHWYVTFIFRYRSREFLLSQGIMSSRDPGTINTATPIKRIPSTPSPMAAPSPLASSSPRTASPMVPPAPTTASSSRATPSPRAAPPPMTTPSPRTAPSPMPPTATQFSFYSPSTPTPRRTTPRMPSRNFSSTSSHMGQKPASSDRSNGNVKK